MCSSQFFVLYLQLLATLEQVLLVILPFLSVNKRFCFFILLLGLEFIDLF